MARTFRPLDPQTTEYWTKARAMAKTYWIIDGMTQKLKSLDMYESPRGVGGGEKALDMDVDSIASLFQVQDRSRHARRDGEFSHGLGCCSRCSEHDHDGHRWNSSRGPLSVDSVPKMTECHPHNRRSEFRRELSRRQRRTDFRDSLQGWITRCT